MALLDAAKEIERVLKSRRIDGQTRDSLRNIISMLYFYSAFLNEETEHRRNDRKIIPFRKDE